MDHGPKRELPTATGEEIKQNIDNLLQEFEQDLRRETVNELEKLRDKHLNCLQSIPLKAGTQLNEGQKHIANILWDSSICCFTSCMETKK